MKALGFAKKTEYFHLTLVKSYREEGGAIIVQMPARDYSERKEIGEKDIPETIVIDITH